jgi:LasA protease
MINQKNYRYIKSFVWLALAIILTGCFPQRPPVSSRMILFTPTPSLAPTVIHSTVTPARPLYQPGELVDYIVQPGDVLPVLAVRFNTTVNEIRKANPVLPGEVTTLPPGLPLKIPIYYLPLWGSAFQIIPDSQFSNGPAQVGFDPAAFVGSQPGWLKDYHEFAYDGERSGVEIIVQIANDYSVSPRMLLALLEYQAGALTLAEQPPESVDYPLGYHEVGHQGLYMQLNWVANTLNNAFYQYLDGQLTSFDHLDGRMERPDPWQNAATAALQYYYSRLLDGDAYQAAVGESGLARSFSQLFGDQWKNPQMLIPGSLQQPKLLLPFKTGKTWAYTGGPHTGWGDGAPLAAIDFAPAVTGGGCNETDEWTTAVADGVIVRTGDGLAILDLDGDNDERTGWEMLYLHLSNRDMPKVGLRVKAGDPIGHPSCEGGHATGTHIHIARKYNGEWLAADGVLPFDLEGWRVANGSEAYLGIMTRGSQTVRACTCSDPATFVTAGK